jgi:hypothetical protein
MRAARRAPVTKIWRGKATMIRDGKFQDVTRRRWSASLLSFGLLFLLCAVAATARHRGG